MDTFIDTYLDSYCWYRNLTLALLSEIPSKYLSSQISSRSLNLRHQLIDMGEFQIKMLQLLTGKTYPQENQPDPQTATSEQILNYLKRCQATFEKILKEDVSIMQNSPKTYFDRLTFTTTQLLHFMLAHEVMHHGEFLSLIYSKNWPMPQSFKDTWGFER